MKEKIYIDFDGTLYDSDNLTRKFLKICQQYGITAEIEAKVEQKLFNDGSLLAMDDIAKYLQKNYNLSSKILMDVEKLYKLPNIYPDVLSALQKLKETNKYEIIILTYGNVNYQKKKIENVKLEPYIKEVIITENAKDNLKQVDYQNSIFIDNNPIQIAKLVNAGAKKVIRIRRPIDKYSSIDSAIPVNEYQDFITLVEKELL